MLYWFMTGFHALHVLIGLGLVGTIAYLGSGHYNAGITTLWRMPACTGTLWTWSGSIFIHCCT